jgi:protein SCO1/2
MRTRSLTTLLLLAAVMISACQPSTKTTDPSEWNDLSVYHLPDDWINQNGESVAFEDLQGQVLVVVMIYTSCQAACPRLVADMRRIEEGVRRDVADQVTYVLVSIDPETDTPEQLKAFAIENGMDTPQWMFLRGSEASVRTFANVVAVKYKQISPIDFSHSNIISVFDQDGVMRFQQEGLGVAMDPIVASVHELTSSKPSLFDWFRP